MRSNLARQLEMRRRRDRRAPGRRELARRKRFMASGLHEDASESAFFAEQLTQIRTRIQEIKYAQLKARTLIPVDATMGPGVEVMKYRQLDQVGAAKIISSYADDAPRADIKGKDFLAEIRSLASSYGYNIQEIRAASLAGMDLVDRKARAARRAIDQEIERIAKLGDSANNLLGLLNQPNALSFTIVNGAAVSPLWSSKTTQEILDDLFGFEDYMVTQTLEVEQPDTLLLPLESRSLLNRRFITGTQISALKYFRENAQYIKEIGTWRDLSTAGAGATRRMISYRRDPEVLGLLLPQDFEQLEPQARNFEWLTNCHARCGGVVAYLPNAISYADGI